jgi:catechol 2,3-dioxygenase-like lactoylglutathione lyase family enzyme
VITGLDHVQLAAPPGCEAEARRFYGDLLGLPEVRKPEPMQSSGGVWFSLGGQQLHVGVEDPFTPSLKAHPGLGVAGEEELEALAHRLDEAGVPVRWDDRLPGVARFYTDDPWGNRLELAAHPRTQGGPLLAGSAAAPGQRGERPER